MPPTTLVPTLDIPVPDDVDPADPSALARALVSDATAHALVLVVDLGGAVRAEPVLDDHPVDALCGRRAPMDASMVGVRAPASVTRREAEHAWHGGVVHLVSRAGVSATVVQDEHGVMHEFGPEIEPQTGRVPDSCRRVLGLATPPPSESMTRFVFCSWLAVILGRLEDVFDWATIVRLHPAAASLGERPTAASVADATRDLGESMEWERFRRVIAAVGGFPFGPEGAKVAAWADAGMFSRWAMDELPPLHVSLDRLFDEVSPDTIDRLWAAAHLCGAVLDD